MKTFLAALASASLLAAPMALSPTIVAAHGVGAGGSRGRIGGFRGGSFRGAGIHNGGFRAGGFRGRGFRGDGFIGDELLFDDAVLGFALGADFSDPWYGENPTFYDGYWDQSGDGAGGAPGATSQYQPRPQFQAQRRQTCGSWNWDAAQSKYSWLFC